MITLSAAYLLMGALLLGVALRAALDAGHPKRWGNTAFWGLLGIAVAAGDWLPAALLGAIAIALALIAGLGWSGHAEPAEAEAARQQREADARRLGHRLLLPALVLPLVTVAGTLGFKYLSWNGQPLVDPKQNTLIALTLACVVALAFALRLTRAPATVALERSRRLFDAIGWAALLPLLLATLGSVFAAAGVGDTLAAIVASVVPADNRFLLVLAYALGMAGFTMIMGNAFAAFPVISAGIALPLLVEGHAAHAAPLAAIGMLAGYCGTLMTPMAANFNIVPVALLGLKDPYAVIRMQIGTALPLLAVNVGLIWWLALP